MRSEASEDPPCLSLQYNSRYLHGVDVPETLLNNLVHVSPAPAVDGLNTNSEENFLTKVTAKGTVQKITLIKKARTKPENIISDLMFEIKSSRGEDASSSMQEDCESGYSVGLPEDSSMAFADESADTTDQASKGGRLFKASKKGPVKKRTSFRKLVGRPDNSNHFIDIESKIGNTRCSVQEDGQSRCPQELSESLCTPYSSVTPFSIENIDMRTREGRMLKASIKEQVKQITLIKRAQKRPEKNILDHALEMKCGPGTVAPSAQEDMTPRCSVEVPDNQSNTLIEAQSVNAEISQKITGETHMLMCETEDVKKTSLARKARKRPWKDTVESVKVDEGALSVHVSESSTTVATSENLCDTFYNVPTVAVEHLNTKMHESRFPRAEIKGEVKKISSVKEVRKRPAKVNLGSTLEMKSEVGKDSSFMQEPTETCSSIEPPESLCDAVAEIPVSTAVKLHTDTDVSHLPMVGAKGEGKIYVNPVHIRPAKNNLDHLLEIGYGDHTSSGQSDTRYHCSAEHTEIHYSTFPADSVHRLHANADDPLLKTDRTGSVKKVTFMKKDKKKTANNTLDTPHEVGSEATDGASSLQYDVDSFPDVSIDTVDGLHSSAEEAILLNTGSKGAVKKMTLIKKDRNRLQKGDSKNVLEMKSGMGFKFSSNEKESSKSSCSFEPRNNLTSADVLPHHAGNIYRHIKESSTLKDSKKGEVAKNTSVKNAHKRSANNNSDHMLENKSAPTENTSKLQEDLRSHRNPQPSENKCHSLSEVQADASELLNAKVGMTCMSNLSEQRTGPSVPIIKNARKMPVKINTKYVSPEDVSLSQEAPHSQCNIKLLENLSSFPDLPSMEREHLPSISEAQMMETPGVVKKVAIMKNPRKRPEKNSDPIFDKVSGSCEAAALSKDSIKNLFGDKVPENTPNAFQCVPPHHAVHFNTNTDEDNLTKMENKGQSKQAVNKIRKRPAKNYLDKVPEIEIGKGENVSSEVEDSMSPGRDGFPKGLYKATSNVAAVPAERTQVKKQEGGLFKPTAKRAVKKMTLSQKPRTGMEKDSERVLQMKSERVDDACYLVQNDSVFRYSVELPESLCSDFPATPQPASDAMVISTDGGRLCLFTAGKKDMAKKKPQVKKTSIGPEETLSDHPHEIEIELGEDASSSVLGDSESLCGLDLAESSCSAFPDVSSDTLENVNMSTEEACFLKASQKGSVGKMTLMQNTETGVEDSELDRLFAMERGGHTDALVQDDSQSSFEIEEVLDTDFSSVLPHTASTTGIGMEEDILLEDSTKENMKKGSQIKSSPSSQESHLDQECKIKSETDENLGAVLHEDSESHFNVEVKDSPGLSPHTVEDVDLSTEADLLDLFQQSTNVEQGLVVIKEETGPGVSTSEPLLKRRGRKKKEPEIEVLPNGEIRVKKKPRLSAKDREGVGKQRKRGRRSESGLSNDGALDGETNLDFGEIFDAVLAEASKWERMRDTEGLKHLGLGEGLSGTGALTAPPLSDNDLYSSVDETEEAFFGYPHAYEQNKFTALKKQKDLIPQVEKRKTSPYFAKQFTEGERQSRDDLTGVGEDTLSGYEDASDEYLEHLLTDTDGDSEDLDLGQSTTHSYNGAGPSGLHLTPSPGSTLPGLEVNCKTVEGAILKTEQKQLSVVKNINEHLRRMERHLANLVKFNRLYISRSLGLTGELVRENASQSLSLQRIAETLESAIPFPTASGVRITAEVAPSSASSSISSNSSDEEWAKRPSKTPKRSKRSREDGMVKKRKKK